MRILVTGGAGFIGANFLQTFVPRHPEDTFVCFDKMTYAGNPRSLDGLEKHASYTFEHGDIADEARVAEVFDLHAPDVVVHFAAESHVDRSIVNPGEFVRTNVVGTLNLLNAAKTRWPRKSDTHLFHHVSTDEVYGSLHDGDPEFTEETRYDPSSPYAASKASSDHLVRAYHRTYGLPVTITNCSNNYGPRQAPEKLIPLTLLNAHDGKELPVYGNGGNKRDWLFVEDHCEAIWTVIQRGARGATYNVGGGEERSNIEVVKALCALVARETGRAPEQVLGLIRFVADRPGHDWRYAVDSAKLERELGWSPKARLETGLQQTVRWYLENAAWVQAARSGEHETWLATNYAARGDAPAGASGANVRSSS